MPFDIIPSIWNSPSRLPSLFEDDDWATFMPNSGLSVSEDEKNVYVEASMPGLDAKNIEVTFDKGVLWLRGKIDEKEEDKDKKFYRKASSSFSYRVSIPGNVDEKQEPDAVYKNGVMKVTFSKVPESQPKKLNIRTE